MPDQMAKLENLKNDLLQRARPFCSAQSIKVSPESRPKGLLGILKRVPGLPALVRLGKGLLSEIPFYAAWLRGAHSPLELRGEYCACKMLRAMERYRPVVYPGDIAYFRSHAILGRAMRMVGWWDDVFFGFRELCAGRFHGYVIGGTHRTILENPEMGSLVKGILLKGTEKSFLNNRS